MKILPPKKLQFMNLIFIVCLQLAGFYHALFHVTVCLYLQVEEMAKKLDNLLEGIEGKGGFRDASITSQTKYVTELEEGIWALSDKCGMWRVCSLSVFLSYNKIWIARLLW